MSQGALLHGSLILNTNLKLLDFGKGQVVRYLGCFKEGGCYPTMKNRRERERERVLKPVFLYQKRPESLT